jgi:hypothetical protein
MVFLVESIEVGGLALRVGGTRVTFSIIPFRVLIVIFLVGCSIPRRTVR